jgi:hypothetical protein
MDIKTLTFDKRDEFKRKIIAEKVITLLEAQIDISPMVIDGSWGTGKTEFCHKLINIMRKDDKHHLVYIDAFKADHANEPLMTVLAEVIKVLPSDESKQSLIKKALPVARHGLKTIAKASVSHLLRQDFADVADDFDKEIQKTADKAIDATVEAILKDHVTADKNLMALQEALSEIASKKPMFLFIDELDRCRPNFAVEMLEIIKHTFDIEGVYFILVTNTQQLRASINHCYGYAVDAQRYLDKFIKFRFELSSRSNRSPYSPVSASSQHFFTLVKKTECLPESYLASTAFCKAVERIILLQALSLREVETLILHIQIVQSLSNSERFVEGQHIGYTLNRLLGVMFVCFRPDILANIKRSDIDAVVIGEFLGVDSIPILGGEVKRPEVLEIIMVMLAKDCTKNTEKYIPKQEQQIEWDKYIPQGFMGDAMDVGESINEIIETANIMAFE